MFVSLADDIMEIFITIYDCLANLILNIFLDLSVSSLRFSLTFFNNRFAKLFGAFSDTGDTQHITGSHGSNLFVGLDL